jgi:hypothetical protein
MMQNTVRDTDAGVPYTFSNGVWVSYDDKAAFTKKVSGKINSFISYSDFEKHQEPFMILFVNYFSVRIHQEK